MQIIESLPTNTDETGFIGAFAYDGLMWREFRYEESTDGDPEMYSYQAELDGAFVYIDGQSEDGHWGVTCENMNRGTSWGVGFDSLQDALEFGARELKATPEIVATRRALIAALESDEYEKGEGTLRGDDSYCVGGVACDVSGVGKWIVVDVYDVDGAPVTTYKYQDSTGAQFGGAISPEIIDAFGMGEFDLSVDAVGEGTRLMMKLRGGMVSLDSINDDGRFSFSEIAQMFRNQWGITL